MSAQEELFPDTGANLRETVKWKYDRHRTGPQGRPSDVVIEEASSPGPGVQTLAVMEEDREGALKRFSSFVLEFADILSRVAKHGGLQTASQQADLLTEISFS